MSFRDRVTDSAGWRKRDTDAVERRRRRELDAEIKQVLEDEEEPAETASGDAIRLTDNSH